MNRKLTQVEYDWLDRDYELGETLYLYNGGLKKYGVISPDGIAVTEIKGEHK